VKFQLTGYQVDAAADVVGAIQDGFATFGRSGKLSAVSLSAPTGAGKTVIATAVIEHMLFGTDSIEPQPDLTVLWVTDDPSLNEQTKRKMLQSSSLIQPSQLVTVDQSLDQKRLDRGKVYFVNIQKLGRATSYVTGNNNVRQYSLWDTIGATISERGDNFVIVVDEAHKGTGNKRGAKTITAQLIDGAGGTLPPTPVVLGISATPERFETAISKAGQRRMDPVKVDAEAVRMSGLIKDKIRIRHPQEAQPGDSTLLALAVRDLKIYDELWSRYAKEQHEPKVAPVLVVQVRAKVTDAEMNAILDTIAGEWSILDGKAVGHSFQEHSTMSYGTRTVRYIAPQDIQDDPHLRVVLFKEALTTGWDCPRAEVMYSFRTAQDYTYIAQLIGRMVRTPLARRISTDDVLNTVALYLPHYDDEQVGRVVAGLESDEDNFSSIIEIDSVTCPRNPQLPSGVWDCFGVLPTYTRPSKHHRNEVSRLNAFATLLAAQIDKSAIETARKHIVDTLAREANRLGQSLDDRIADFERLTYQTQTVVIGTGEVKKETSTIPVNARNIDDLFRRARRSLGDAAASWYWDMLCDDGQVDPDDAKIKVAALADDPSVETALESSARELIATWRKEHNGAIGDLPDAKRAAFYAIWQQAKKPEQVSMIMPDQITAADKSVSTKDGTEVVIPVPRHKLHVFANGKHEFPASLTGWEADVLSAELAKKSLVAWYRNPTGGAAALAVPYDQSGVARTMYPDFVFFHEIDGEMVIDIVDPHQPNAADTGPKWTGLAQYAMEHGSVFRRVAAVIKSGDKLLSLDLKIPQVLERIGEATNETDVRAIFDELGGSY